MSRQARYTTYCRSCGSRVCDGVHCRLVHGQPPRGGRWSEYRMEWMARMHGGRLHRFTIQSHRVIVWIIDATGGLVRLILLRPVAWVGGTLRDATMWVGRVVLRPVGGVMRLVLGTLFRFVWRYCVAPVGRGTQWLAVRLWRLVAPVLRWTWRAVRYLCIDPLDRCLTCVGRGVRWTLDNVCGICRRLYEGCILPVGRAVGRPLLTAARVTWQSGVRPLVRACATGVRRLGHVLYVGSTPLRYVGRHSRILAAAMARRTLCVLGAPLRAGGRYRRHQQAIRAFQSGVTPLKQRLLQAVTTCLVREAKSVNEVAVLRNIVDLTFRLLVDGPEGRLYVAQLACFARETLHLRSVSLLLAACHAAALLPAENDPHTTTVILRCVSSIPDMFHLFQHHHFVCRYLPTAWLPILYPNLNTVITNRSTIPRSARSALLTKFSTFTDVHLSEFQKRTFPYQPANIAPVSPAAIKTPPTTLKFMIRHLHISQPAHAVCCILGRKYPETNDEFIQRGLEGTYDPDKRGVRMKLVPPITWERCLSDRGNKGSTWNQVLCPWAGSDPPEQPPQTASQLLRMSSVSYLSLLRNIRNILLCTGVEPMCHDTVVTILGDESCVLRSNVLPFQFLAAFQVLAVLGDPDEAAREVASLTEVRVRPAARGRGKRQRGRRDARDHPDYPFLDGDIFKEEEPDAPPANFAVPEVGIVRRYQEAVQQAVRWSLGSTAVPLLGNTAVLCDVSVGMRAPLSRAFSGMGSSTRKVDAAYLVASLLSYTSEEADVYLYGGPREMGAPSWCRAQDVRHLVEEGQLLEATKVLTTQSLLEVGPIRQIPVTYFTGWGAAENEDALEPPDRLVFITDASGIEEFLVNTTGWEQRALYRGLLSQYRVARPDGHVVFWSMEGVSDLPEAATVDGVSILSGFSDTVLRMVAMDPGSLVAEVEGVQLD